jgi:hypothetical protein
MPTNQQGSNRPGRRPRDQAQHANEPRQTGGHHREKRRQSRDPLPDRHPAAPMVAFDEDLGRRRWARRVEAPTLARARGIHRMLCPPPPESQLGAACTPAPEKSQPALDRSERSPALPAVASTICTRSHDTTARQLRRRALRPARRLRWPSQPAPPPPLEEEGGSPPPTPQGFARRRQLAAMREEKGEGPAARR